MFTFVELDKLKDCHVNSRVIIKLSNRQLRLSVSIPSCIKAVFLTFCIIENDH